MNRLGLRLTLRSGREAAVRLLVTMGAVAIGVAVLLSVLADYHAYQVTSRRPSWESTTGTQAAPADPSSAELWNYSESIYQGRFIETLDVAALGPGAPRIPGLSALPGPGEYVPSPALATLLATVPADQLGDRFLPGGGKQVGSLGEAALPGPTALAIVVGYTPAQLQAVPGTTVVTHIVNAPHLQGTTQIYRFAFAIGAVLLLFPLLILVGTATRLATARREERYAAMRLVGATPHQINVIASVDAVISGLLGVVVGCVIFLLIRPALAHVSLSGARFFTDTVTPTAAGYAGLIVGVPLASAAASLWSLRRVRITPLGVARRVTPPPPRAWRLIPLAVGLPLIVYSIANGAKATGKHPPTLEVFLGLILVMSGLVLGGSWLTMWAARGLARIARGGSAVLAARRLADNPKGAFRAVSGLVLAVFVGTAIAGLAPAGIAAQSTGNYSALNNVLRIQFVGGPGDRVGAQQGAALIAQLEAIAGVSVIPLYANPALAAFEASQPPPPGPNTGPNAGRNPGPNPGPDGGLRIEGQSPPPDTVVTCASLQRLRVLGACPGGAAAVQLDSQELFIDNPLLINKDLPLVTARSPAAAGDVSALALSALLVKATSPAALERARTTLTAFNAARGQSFGPKDGDPLTGWQMGELEPETFAEVAAIRNNDANNINKVVLLGTALTILVAGCSLAVAIGGSLVDRRRPFTLMRVSGTPTSTLYRAVFLESGLPLLIAALVSALVGLGVVTALVYALVHQLGSAAALVHGAHPGGIYYLSIGSGLAASIGIILLTLPLLGRMTLPQNARFE